MTLTYRGAGAWGPGKGGPLTSAEIDGNIYHLAQAIQAIADNPGEPVQFQSFELVGNALYVHLSNGDVHGPYAFPAIAYQPPAVRTVSAATLTPILSEANNYYRCTNSTACAVTIPKNADVGFPTGTMLEFVQAVAGAITLAGDTGVTLNPKFGCSLVSAGQGAKLVAKKVSADVWDLSGDFAAA